MSRHLRVALPLLSLLLNSGCGGFSIAGLSSGNFAASNTVVCRDSEQLAAFQKSYWPFFQSKCVSCHGAGVSGRAFASSNLAEAYSSFKVSGGTGYKDQKANANAVNPLHGSPATNGPFNQATIDQASSDFQQGLAAACAAGNADSGSSPPATKAVGTTVGVMNQNTVLGTYSRLTGTTPSADTLRKIYGESSVNKGFHASRRFILPSTSQVSSVNSSTVMMTLVIASEHCNDLVNKEKALAASSRVFFGPVDLTATSMAAITPAQSELILNTMAQQFWRRSITPEELTTMQAAVSAMKVSGESAQQGLLDLCVIALSSHSATVR